MENLSKVFLQKIKPILGSDFQNFLNSYCEPPFRAVRVNTLKCSPERFVSLAPFPIQPVPFCTEGFYVQEDGLGHHPYHHAGVFYVQEPSALSAVTALDPQPGERILDLCAAPGGKSTQIAARLAGKGLLVSNEYVPSRANILLSNIERMGIRNAVVTNLHPDRLCGRLEGWFDRVLVDAPCSGEGMFRKDPRAVEEWSDEHSKSCAVRQLGILQSAKEAVRPGGVLVYSTCTFSLDENEMVVCSFLNDNPDFELEQVPAAFGTPSRQEWLDTPHDLTKMHRIFPHQGGEGHFVARLRRKGSAEGRTASVSKPVSDPLFEEFWSSFFDCPIPETVSVVRDSVYILPRQMPPLSGLKVVRAGILAGKLVKNRFLPSHQLMMCGYPVREDRQLDLAGDDPRITNFLRGMEIPCSLQYKSWCAVTVDGFVLGLGKASNGRMKNHYPKGLRELR